MPKLDQGHAVILLSAAFFVVASYAIFFSFFLPPVNLPILQSLAEDTHYKYFAILIIPTTFYFAIANWVGWQYYSNS